MGPPAAATRAASTDSREATRGIPCQASMRVPHDRQQACRGTAPRLRAGAPGSLPHEATSSPGFINSSSARAEGGSSGERSVGGRERPGQGAASGRPMIPRRDGDQHRRQERWADEVRGVRRFVDQQLARRGSRSESPGVDPQFRTARKLGPRPHPPSRFSPLAPRRSSAASWTQRCDPSKSAKALLNHCPGFRSPKSARVEPDLPRTPGRRSRSSAQHREIVLGDLAVGGIHPRSRRSRPLEPAHR